MSCRMGFKNCTDSECTPNCSKMREWSFLVKQEIAFQKFWVNVIPKQKCLVNDVTRKEQP